MKLGQRLKELRHQHGLSQRALAARAGVDELELMALADKVPSVLATIARDEDAVRFFRRATETIKSPEGWQYLLAYLERSRQEAKQMSEEDNAEDTADLDEFQSALMTVRSFSSAR